MDLLAIPASLLTKAGIKNPKPVIYGALAIIAGIVILSIIKRARQNADRKAQERMDSGLSLSETTLSKGEAVLIAQNLLNAMLGWGTDEAAIFDNLERAKSKGDLLLIIENFGLQPKTKMKTLNEWLRDELSGRDLQRVKDIYSTLNVPF
jgi:hypothetical protein